VAFFCFKQNLDLYIYSPIRLHGVVLNLLSTGTILPLLIGRVFLTTSLMFGRIQPGCGKLATFFIWQLPYV
jgi:hypothetical protein